MFAAELADMAGFGIFPDPFLCSIRLNQRLASINTTKERADTGAPARNSDTVDGAAELLYAAQVHVESCTGEGEV